MHPDGTWMRIRGKVLWDDSKEAKIAMLEQNPDLKRLYQADDGKMEVCHLVEAEATLYSFTADPISVALYVTADPLQIKKDVSPFDQQRPFSLFFYCLIPISAPAAPLLILQRKILFVLISYET